MSAALEILHCLGDHRIKEVREGTSGGPLVQPQGHVGPPEDQDHVQMALKYFYVLPGQPVPAISHLYRKKKVFPDSHIEPPVAWFMLITSS